MADGINLDRFLKVEESDYEIALSEVKDGRKRSHWMWYIFPQIKGLGFSEISKYYAIKDEGEAMAFLQHPILGNRLTTICKALLDLHENNANKIFGNPDDMKLKSCVTLFLVLPQTNPVFQSVLDKFFDGKQDIATLKILEK